MDLVTGTTYITLSEILSQVVEIIKYFYEI